MTSLRYERYIMSTSMHRLQISLPDKQVNFLRERSRQTQKSMGSIIRELVERESWSSEGPITEDPIWEIVGIGHGGKARGEIDETAYAEDWYARPPRKGQAAAVGKRLSHRRKATR